MLLLIVLIENIIEYCVFRIRLIVEPLPWPDTLHLSGKFPPPIVVVVVVRSVIVAAAIVAFPPPIVVVVVRSVIVAATVVGIKF